MRQVQESIYTIYEVMKRFLLPFLSILSIAFVGCSPEYNAEPVLGTKQLKVSFFEGTYSSDVTSEYDWEASTSNDWITLAENSGSAGASKIEFSVSQNPTFQKRKGGITVCIKGSKRPVTISVEQAANDFEITVSDITATSAEQKIIAKDPTRAFYWYNATKEDFINYYGGNTVTMMNSIHAMLQSYIDMGAFPSWNSLLSTGSSTFSAKGLKTDTEYIIIAFGVSRSGVITSEDASYVWYKTEAE